MKSMHSKDAITLLENNGFALLRSNGHLIYGRGMVRVALSHGRIVSPAIMREIYKAIAKAQTNQVKAA